MAFISNSAKLEFSSFSITRIKSRHLRHLVFKAILFLIITDQLWGTKLKHFFSMLGRTINVNFWGRESLINF